MFASIARLRNIVSSFRNGLIMDIHRFTHRYNGIEILCIIREIFAIVEFRFLNLSIFKGLKKVSKRTGGLGFDMCNNKYRFTSPKGLADIFLSRNHLRASGNYSTLFFISDKLFKYMVTQCFSHKVTLFRSRYCFTQASW